MALGRFLRGLLPGAGSGDGGGPGDGGNAASSAAPGAPAGSPSSPSSVAGRPVNAWRGLPPIQRTVTAAPLVAPTSTFRAALPTARRAPTALAPLRHERGLSAPAGLVTGIAAPIQRETAAVPASVRPAGIAARPTATDAAAGPAAWRLAETSAPESAAWPAFGDGGVPAPAALPALRLAPAVAPAAPSAPLTRSTAPVAVPGGRVGGAPVAAREATAAAPVPVAAPPSVPAIQAPAAPVAGPGGAGPAPLVARSEESARPAPSGPARRLRIGAPIAPVTGRPTMQRTWAADGSAASPVAQPPLPAPARAAPPSAPGPVVAREEAGHQGHAHGPDGEEPGPGPAAAEPARREADVVPIRPIAVARSADAPLVGTLQPMVSPASPAVAIRLQAERDDEADAGPASGSPEAALAALSRMDAGAGIPGPFAASGAGPGAAGAVRPSLFPATSSTPWGRPGPGATPSAPVLPSVSRSVSAPAAPAGPSRPAPLSRTITRGAAPSGTALAAPAFPAGFPPGAGLAWDPVHGMTGPGVQRHAADQAADHGAGAPAASVLPSTAVGGAATLPPPPRLAPMVARESADTPAIPMQREEAATGEAGGSGAGGSASAGGGAAAMPEAELDALARRLHDKIASRISRDLLIERERAGNLVDRGW